MAKARNKTKQYKKNCLLIIIIAMSLNLLKMIENIIIKCMFV